jgi:hypothetical protein
MELGVLFSWKFLFIPLSMLLFGHPPQLSIQSYAMGSSVIDIVIENKLHTESKKQNDLTISDP